MPIEWNPDTREFHLRNDQISYVGRVLENGWIGHLYFGAALADGRSYAHLAPGEFYGFSNRLGEPVAARVPDAAAAATTASRPWSSSSRTARACWICGTRATGSCPASRPSRPAVDVHRGRWRGGDARDHAGGSDRGLEVRLLYTIYRDRPVVVRSARIVNTRQGRR